MMFSKRRTDSSGEESDKREKTCTIENIMQGVVKSSAVPRMSVVIRTMTLKSGRSTRI